MARISVQASAPEPDPELKKLSVFLGHWRRVREYKPGLLGPPGKFTIDWTTRMILGGFFLEGRLKQKGPTGWTQGLEIFGYDPVNKNFPHQAYTDDGSTFSGVLTVAQNTYTWTGQFAVAGKPYQAKATFIPAADLASGTFEGEISVDGKTWTPWFEEKYTKVKPAAKK